MTIINGLQWDWAAWRAKLSLNITTLWRKAVTWVSVLWGAAYAWWLLLGPDGQAPFLQQYPKLTLIAPFFALVTILGSRIWPQKPDANTVQVVKLASGTTIAAIVPAAQPLVPSVDSLNVALQEAPSSPDPRDSSYRPPL